jgi:hypothetical protein
MDVLCITMIKSNSSELLNRCVKWDVMTGTESGLEIVLQEFSSEGEKGKGQLMGFSAAVNFSIWSNIHYERTTCMKVSRNCGEREAEALDVRS